MSSSTTSSATSSATTSASATLTVPSNLKVVGIILAIVSGILIGSSFVFKKTGLLRSQAGGVAGEGVAYLKSPLWWTGMILMILGELCNFAAYAFVEAIVVTPMGALSVVISAILSSIFLKEKLSFFGWLGCALCILGSVIIALNGPSEPSIGQITEFEKMFLAVGFIVYASVLIVAALVIIFYFAPRYGKKSMMWYIMVCSMIGGISVSVTTGLGSAIVTSAMGDNQFKHWFIYFLIVFVAVTLITEVYYLNVALALFNTAMVTPTYYVIFTFFSILTTIVLFQGLQAPAVQIITLVMGFLVICFGITILQLSKIDPAQMKRLDRRSTMLLQAARSNTEGVDEKSIAAYEDPGMDALRGNFGTMASILRARTAKRMSMSSRGTNSLRTSRAKLSDPENADAFAGLKRHQLYDAPVSRTPDAFSIDGDSENISMTNTPRASKKPTIKFDSEEIVHSYYQPGTGDGIATHERRDTPYNVGASYEEVDPKGSMDSIFPLEDDGDLRSAPPALNNFDSADPFYRPHASDPFENSPSTTTVASFQAAPKNSTTGSRALSPTRHHHLFGRSSSGGRHYPKGSDDEDREESMSLWNKTEEDSNELAEPEAGVRLVPSSNTRF